MEKIRVGQRQNEQVVGLVVRKRPLSIGLAAALWHSRHTWFSFPPKHSAIPLPELLFRTSLFGSLLWILNFHIKCQCFRDTLPDITSETELGPFIMIPMFFFFLFLLITVTSNYLCDYYLFNVFLPTTALRGKYWFCCVCPWIFSTHHSALAHIRILKNICWMNKWEDCLLLPTKTVLCFFEKIYIMLWVILVKFNCQLGSSCKLLLSTGHCM